MSSTSNLDNLGQDLIDTVTKKVRVPLNDARVQYIKQRLYDRAYQLIKDQADNWLKNGGEPPVVTMELQDVYLADPSLPSGVGKLVKEDWRKYPPFGVTLGLIRPGTYSATTRALSLQYLTSPEEQKAFIEYLSEANPFRISSKQALLFLYSLLENDGEVIAPLWAQLVNKYDNSSFTDRDAGNLLPEIYHIIITRHRKRSLSVALRERLEILEKSAESIARARQSERYSGGSARENSSRVRVEPFADIGLLNKPDSLKYEYKFSAAGRILAKALAGVEDSQDVEMFLFNHFFATAAAAWEMSSTPISEPSDIVPHLHRAWKEIASSSGYAPIEEIALVAGIEALLDHGLIIELAVAREALLVYQKAHPYEVRFTVDRMGVLAHVRFMEGRDT
jgi:hypothetical protein